MMLAFILLNKLGEQLLKISAQKLDFAYVHSKQAFTMFVFDSHKAIALFCGENMRLLYKIKKQLDGRREELIGRTKKINKGDLKKNRLFKTGVWCLHI